MAAVGHAHAREVLLADLPAVTVLIGPRSVGKRTLAQEVVEAHGVPVLEFFEGVTMDDAREIRLFLGSESGARAVIIRLDGVRAEVSHLLLKTLEELGEGKHVIFLCEQRPLATILSRAWVFQCGYLNDAEMSQILFNLGVPPTNIPIIVSRGRGQVSEALDSLDVEIEKAPITALLGATAKKDEVMFGKIVSRLQESHLHLLRVWASEAQTGMWRLFAPDESYGLEPYAQAVGRALESKARPRLLVRSVMGRLMEVSK